MVKVNPQVMAASPYPGGKQVSGGLGSAPSQQSQRSRGSQPPQGGEGRGWPHPVLGGAEPLEAVQGQQVGRVLVQELGGLSEPALLAQPGSAPKLCLPAPVPGVALLPWGLRPDAHGPLGVGRGLLSGPALRAPCLRSPCRVPAAALLTGGSSRREEERK